VFLFIGAGIPCLVISQAIAGAIARALSVSVRDPLVLTAAQSFAYVVLFGLLAMILRVGYDAPFWRSLGWIHSRLSLIAAFAIGLLLAFFLAILSGWMQLHVEDSEIQQLLHSPHRAAVIIFAVTLGPLAEELAFRGFLQPLVVRSLGAIAGITLTGLFFGLLHLPEYGSWKAALMVGLAGIGFGVIRQLTGSTRASTFAHVGFNSTLFISLFDLGRNMKANG
jgi:membrane protease YdiL (CAAX protease family)